MPSYQTLREEGVTDDLLENTFNAEGETMSASRLSRLLDCLLCRRGSGSLMLLLDLLYLAATCWMFFDMGLAFARVRLLADHSWIVALFVVPAVIQVVFLLLRLRYVFAGVADRRLVSWQLRYTTRPLTHSLAETLPVSVYLFLMPLFGGALTPPEQLPAGLYERFALTWQVAAVRPSILSVTALALVCGFCNWRVSAKHRWRVRTFVHLVQARASEASASKFVFQPKPAQDEVRYTGTPMATLRPRGKAPTAIILPQRTQTMDSDGEYSPRMGARQSPRDHKTSGKKKSKKKNRQTQLQRNTGQPVELSLHSINEENW